ncbi:MAG: hypothetical protein ISR77_38405 [Pirellulaceae bacterium]|nr:hypothetical protein [Pirellulaceae bacterium]
MTKPCVLSLAALVASFAAAGELDDLCWSERFENIERWTALPAWLGNPAGSASLVRDDSAACFQVDEPNRGMKWSASMPSIALDESPFLVVRYRAENLNTTSTDYVVYFDDGVVDKELRAIRLCDVVADGQWHVAAVDLTTLTEAEGVSKLAVQVQAGRAGKARLWMDRLALVDVPPDDAQIIERTRTVPSKADWIVPLAEAKWTAQPSWLDNPGSDPAVERDGETTVFRVAVPGRGMKWSWGMPAPIELVGRRYVAMRYRATGARPVGDYAVCGLGKTPEGQSAYRALVPATELVCDGRWHTLTLSTRRVAAELPEITDLAVQVQAAEPEATLEISDLRLTNDRMPRRLDDLFVWSPTANWKDFHTASVASQANGKSASWCRHLRIDRWFSESEATIEGIPLQLVSSDTNLAATPVRRKAEVRFPIDKRGTEVYLLLLSAMTGMEEPTYGGGRLRAIRDVDRFRLRLEYADGTIDECLPMNMATRQFGVFSGVQAVVAAADPSKPLTAVVVCDRSRQAGFAVAAITVRTAEDRLVPEALDESSPLRIASAEPQQQVSLELGVKSDRLPVIEQLIHLASGWDCLRVPCPLVKLRVDGKESTPDDGLRVVADVDRVSRAEYSVRIRVENTSDVEHTVDLTAPVVGPYRLSDQAEDSWYLLPRRGTAFDNRPCSYRERYCGLFPVQFVDTFAPACGRGFTLRTEDTDCVRKHYLLEKSDGEFTIGVEYPGVKLAPGQAFETPPTVLSATDGDWHHGLSAYRKWLATWYRPLSPRKPWFREIFNFRQRFLWGHDPLYDAKAGELDLRRAVDEARKEFGGIDYLHLFDWGSCPGIGRIYGRTGDHSPYDYLAGGREGLRREIAAVQAMGVPVGLYIEGYLLQQRGKLGQQFGPKWQLVGSDGQGMWWPDSDEMFVCSGVDAWREVQASTYATKVRELDVDGMYLDQFGFAGSYKDCWSADHGHPVPSYVVRTERDTTRAVRQRIDGTKPDVALYTEESPVDVTSQYQDGSFTYAMFSTQRSQTRVPLNLFRFAVPDFKTIEILFCDKPTGSWATGVRWVFFNGEAIWLEGPATEWFEPETRAEIRRCYRILREHRDAFATTNPVPLVPSEQGGICINAFPVEKKTVYTFYNARHRTVRGPVLSLPHSRDALYHDAWNDRPADVRLVDGHDVVHLEIGPHGAGCLVVQSNEVRKRRGGSNE